MGNGHLPRQEWGMDSAALPPSLAWARALVAELMRQGVRDVVLAPGSRSAPLAYVLAAAADAGALRLHVRVDERAAGFLALGLAKGSEPLVRETSDGATVPVPRPVAVVTTSGTAVANLHPAVLEAHHTGIPLVLLTADRPHELRGTGASQTTDQVGIFGTAVRYDLDLPAPDGRTGEVRDLLAATGRALTAALGVRDRNPGPVHLNLGFREPLHPSTGVSGLWTSAPDASGEPRPVVVPAGRGAGTDPVVLGDPARTLVVAGDGAGPDARRLAEAQGWPLLAEPSSGACGGPNAVSGYRMVLGVEDLTGEVEQVVVFGHPTLSRPVQRLLARPGVAVTVVAPGGGPWPDAARNAAAVVDRLCGRWFAPPGEPRDLAFLARWRAASQAAAAVLVPLTSEAAEVGSPVRSRQSAPPTAERTAGVAEGPLVDRGAAPSPEGDVDPLAVARAVAAATGPQDVLVVGSSNPVRDLDLVLGLDAGDDAPPPVVIANRGLAGIDGIVSTAAGVALARAAAGSAGATRALLGDLTFLHDVGGLLRGPLEPACDLQLVVVNDDGGSIFATLEHGEVAAASDDGATAVERVFATPHGADLAALCAGYGVRHRLVTNVAGLRSALAASPEGVEVIEVRASRAGRLVDSRALQGEVAEAVRRATRRSTPGAETRHNVQ